MKSWPVDLRQEDEAASFPPSSFRHFLLDKGLYDCSFAHSYQLARKMDSDISKVSASVADLLMSLVLYFNLENNKCINFK